MKTAEEMEEIEVELSVDALHELEEWAQQEGKTIDELVCEIVVEKLNELKSTTFSS